MAANAPDAGTALENRGVSTADRPIAELPAIRPATANRADGEAEDGRTTTRGPEAAAQPVASAASDLRSRLNQASSQQPDQGQQNTPSASAPAARRAGGRPAWAASREDETVAPAEPLGSQRGGGVAAPITAAGSKNPSSSSSSTPSPEETAQPAPAAPAAPAKPPAAAHDIKLEVASGDQRVEVRLVDRGGEVHLAVRTPDAKLSGALRDNLPELAARLEGTGYRAGGSGGAANQPRQGAPFGAPDSRQQPDGRQRQRDAQTPQDFEQRNRKQKGNDFAWFMSSLR